MMFLIGIIFVFVATKVGIIPAIAFMAVWLVLWIISRIGKYPPEIKSPPRNAEEDKNGFGVY